MLTGVAREGDILVKGDIHVNPPGYQTAIVVTGQRLRTGQVLSQIERWDLRQTLLSPLRTFRRLATMGVSS